MAGLQKLLVMTENGLQGAQWKDLRAERYRRLSWCTHSRKGKVVLEGVRVDLRD